MKETPIALTPIEVIGVLRGLKTEIRRVLEPQIVPLEGDSWNGTLDWESDQDPLRKARVTGMGKTFFDDVIRFGSPYGQIGDLLWVQEPFTTVEGIYVPGIRMISDGHEVFPRFADLKTVPEDWSDFIRHRPPSDMPCWGLTLRIIDLRLERLQDIQPDSVLAEGIPRRTLDIAEELGAFVGFWNSINPKHPWDSNPWVLVIKFEVVSE